MLSLVADYSDSSESEAETSSNESEKEDTDDSTSPPPKLPSASSALANAAAKKTGEVFSNPFLEAELNKTASLERHVKMVNNDAHLKLKNGKKICWNYRKGRCRFGTSCQYAHDSDLSNSEAAAAANEPPKVEATVMRPTLAAKASSSSSSSAAADNNKRKRPGLGDTIEPSKRVIRSYQQQSTATRRH